MKQGGRERSKEGREEGRKEGRHIKYRKDGLVLAHRCSIGIILEGCMA
jgi:hypothetical protein